jgi:hypothetical protein
MAMGMDKPRIENNGLRGPDVEKHPAGNRVLCQSIAVSRIVFGGLEGLILEHLGGRPECIQLVGWRWSRGEAGLEPEKHR